MTTPSHVPITLVPPVDERSRPGTRCHLRCPVCTQQCLGGPPRYATRHLCADLHQWGGEPRD